jgi:hypothetical protein
MENLKVERPEELEKRPKTSLSTSEKNELKTLQELQKSEQAPKM